MSETVRKQRIVNQVRTLAPSLRDHSVVEAGLVATVVNCGRAYSPGAKVLSGVGFAAALAEMAPEVLGLEAQFKDVR